MDKKKKILVIDAHAMAYRGHFALERQNLTNAAGMSTGAIFGFFRMFLKVLQDFDPDETLVAWDPPRGSFRSEIYDQYKATRKPMPDDLRAQIVEIKEIIRRMGFAHIEVPGFEADDVMGSIAARFGKKSQVLLLTSDKDCFQLLNDNVHMLKGTKGVTDFIEVDPDWVKKEIGVTPAQITDYMALVGDTSDNIPGAKGVGPKTAAELISQFKSIDGIYKNLDKIKRDALRNNLAENEKNVRISKELATIRTDMDAIRDYDETKLQTPLYYTEGAIDHFRKEGYRLISDELKKIALKKEKAAGKQKAPADAQDSKEIKSKADSKKTQTDETPVKKTKRKSKEDQDTGDLFEADPETGKKEYFKPGTVSYHLVSDLESLKSVIASYEKSTVVAVDTETSGVDQMRADLVGISISVAPGVAHYIALPPEGNDYATRGLKLKDALSVLAPFFANSKIRFVGQNLKFDYVILKRHGMEITNVHFDCMLAGYLLNPNVRRHSMDDLALDYLQYTTIPFDVVVGSGRKQTTMDKLPPENIRDYACEDADVTLKLFRVLNNKLSEQHLDKVNREIEVPLIPALAHMEMAGVKIDLKYFEKLSADYKKQIARIEKSIFEDVGHVFNLNSTRELQVVFIEKLRLPMAKKIKTGFSTDQRELEKMRGLHPVIDRVLEYRKYTKLLGTYVDALPELIHPQTGRIHTTFHQAVAATGRLSSMDPNLQNIPVREDAGRAIRRGFIAEEGSLLSLDYSQVELRIMAHYSKDPALIEAFVRDDIDIHSRTAASMFGISEKEVTSDMRSKAKVVNFSIIYGVTEFGLAQSLGVPRQEAALYIQKFFEKYPGVRRYMDDTIEFAKKSGYVETLLGRRRQIPDVTSSNRFRREGAERTAINTPIQGTSADLIKKAMIQIHARMIQKKLKSKMILQVHDELLFEVVDSEKDELLSLATGEMEKADLLVPLRVDAGWGKNWDETKG